MIWIVLTLFVLALTATVLGEKLYLRTDASTYEPPDSLCILGGITLLLFLVLLALGIAVLAELYDCHVINEQIEFLSNNAYTINITGDTNVSADVNATKIMDLQTELISLEKTLKILLFM